MDLSARVLQNLAPWRSAQAWCVALSGGLDSSVLLHLLVSARAQESLPPLKAIHVHHGLQSQAGDWAEHCRSVCRQLEVELHVAKVQVPAVASLEQAARQARYQAFAQYLGDGEVLLAAQHQDDQAETLLFRLLRGAGVLGLAAMKPARPLEAGALVRPLLGVPQAQLQTYALEHGLCWVEDPSNQSTAYDRNYLRLEVAPLLRQRWPQFTRAFARTAQHMSEAVELLDELAAEDLAVLQRQASPWPWLDVPSLPISALCELSEARQKNLLRYWLRDYVSMPDTEHWQGWQHLRDAGADAQPIWHLGSGQLRREAGRIWWLTGAWLESAPSALVDLPVASPFSIELPNNGRLWSEGKIAGERLYAAYRQGGERMQLPNRGGRDLKRLLNEEGVPSFVRARLPLLFLDEQLVAVANLPLCSLPGFALHWQPLK